MVGVAQRGNADSFALEVFDRLDPAYGLGRGDTANSGSCPVTANDRASFWKLLLYQLFT
jgi:hypothetical protein